MKKIVLGDILTVGAISIVGAIVVKKIDNIQKEIEYFEDCKDVFYTRKQHENYLKKLREKSEES